MSLVQKKIMADFCGNIGGGLMGLAFIPFHIRVKGVDVWGVVGILEEP